MDLRHFFLLLLAGGSVYVCIELLWRGRSHGSMFLCGGLCTVLIGMLNEWAPAVRLSVQPELCRLGLPGAAAQLPRADLPAVFLRLARHRAAGGLSGRRRAVSGLRRGDRAVLLILIPPKPRRGRVR